MEAIVPILAWADEIDEYPKCVDDLKSAEFGDILRYAAEEVYLDNHMVAIVGTEEERQEPRTVLASPYALALPRSPWPRRSRSRRMASET